MTSHKIIHYPAGCVRKEVVKTRRLNRRAASSAPGEGGACGVMFSLDKEGLSDASQATDELSLA